MYNKKKNLHLLICSQFYSVCCKWAQRSWSAFLLQISNLQPRIRRSHKTLEIAPLCPAPAYSYATSWENVSRSSQMDLLSSDGDAQARMGGEMRSSIINHPYCCLFINAALKSAPGFLQIDNYTGKKRKMGQEGRGRLHMTPLRGDKKHTSAK